MKLNNSEFKLTDLEKRCLNYILKEGSYFEEAGGNEEVKEEGYCFIGWEIYENEIPGCRGAIASLVKKGIIIVDDSDDVSAYYIKYELEFEEGSFHTIKF